MEITKDIAEVITKNVIEMSCKDEIQGQFYYMGNLYNSYCTVVYNEDFYCFMIDYKNNIALFNVPSYLHKVFSMSEIAAAIILTKF